MHGIAWKKFLLAAAAFILIGNLLANYFQQRDRKHTRTTALTGSSPELRVVSSTQSADGVTNADLTPQLVSALEMHGAGRIAAKLEAMAQQTGTPAPPPQIKSESVVIESQGKRLAVIRYEINATSRAVEVLGISGPNLDRVMCARESLEEILLTTGECAQKVKAVHGVTIGG